MPREIDLSRAAHFFMFGIGILAHAFRCLCFRSFKPNQNNGIPVSRANHSQFSIMYLLTPTRREMVSLAMSFRPVLRPGGNSSMTWIVLFLEPRGHLVAENKVVISHEKVLAALMLVNIYKSSGTLYEVANGFWRSISLKYEPCRLKGTKGTNCPCVAAGMKQKGDFSRRLRFLKLPGALYFFGSKGEFSYITSSIKLSFSH